MSVTSPFLLKISLTQHKLIQHRAMGDEFPEATITGTDLSPIQPSWVPPNCHFEIDDFNKEYGRENSYDLVHTRELLGTIPNWVDFFKKAYA
jgi:hypothetical protein